MRELWSKYSQTHPTPYHWKKAPSISAGIPFLATRLIFEIRKTFVVNAPLGLIFDEPAISGLVKAVEALRNADLRLTYKEPITPPQKRFPWSPSEKNRHDHRVWQGS